MPRPIHSGVADRQQLLTAAMILLTKQQDYAVCTSKD